jgi:hypothetical protein
VKFRARGFVVDRAICSNANLIKPDALNDFGVDRFMAKKIQGCDLGRIFVGEGRVANAWRARGGEVIVFVFHGCAFTLAS